MFEILAETLRRSTVQIYARRHGAGSGVIWNAEGLVVTNAHVIESRECVVETPDGRKLEAVLVKRDARRDLAVLRVSPAAPWEPAALGDSRNLRAGQVVLAVGNPLGVSGAVTTGIIHATSRKEWIQADISLAPGNSGGMLADTEGRLIGINSMIYQGIALAVPTHAIALFLARAFAGARAA